MRFAPSTPLSSDGFVANTNGSAARRWQRGRGYVRFGSATRPCSLIGPSVPTVNDRSRVNREVHARFWESARLKCLAPLDYLHAYDTVSDARAQIGRYLAFYNARRPHSAHQGRTPDQVYVSGLPSLAQAA
ncbi:integrase core domain-containing protein [Asticcacaulis sp. EMRT-3]|nr:integrase core domain-containing protein [Asticcacaulis sp. EMRT-3]MDI7774759.1 integrase core domain-containing protein [Asticcacaulis sp. EMRT-3]